MMALRRDLDERIAFVDREKVHDRLHGFLMGFSQLRALEGANAAFMVADFVEALEDMPIETVHQACKGWNQRRFKWPNYSFPPTPPDMRRAAEEVKVEMQVERYDLHLILLAKINIPLIGRTITQEQRDEAIARWESTRADILKASAALDSRTTAAGTQASEQAQARADLERMRVVEVVDKIAVREGVADV